MNPTLKSILAILAGFLFIVVLSTVSDIVLWKTGFLIMEHFDYNQWWTIAFVVAYRTVYVIIGCYIAASIAPNPPMRHAMILGIIGLVACIIGLIIKWDVPPHWYPIALIILALPGAWVGGRMKSKSA